MKNYLCFGDSNTWGYVPASDGQRYPYEQRICGILQTRLGKSVRVIEEALNGRMTHWNDPLDTNKNGARQLPFILDAHRPLDLVSIMLGTNDMKHYMGLDPVDSALGMSKLIDLIRERNCGRDEGNPEIIVIAPPPYVDAARPFGRIFEGAAEKSKRFPAAYKEIAHTQDVHFFDASAAAIPPMDGDGVHIDSQGCAAIGHRLADFIQQTIGW